jgi:hypothetical protein
MTFDYSDVADTAADLIAEFGGSITLRHYSTGTYNPATWESTVTHTDKTVNGVLMDFGAGQTTIRGTLIQGGDKRLLIDSAEPPLLQDHFIIRGVEYTIVSMGEINPAGTAVMYDLHIRT